LVRIPSKSKKKISRQAKKMAMMRTEFIKAMGGHCQWIKDNEEFCEVTDIEILEIHHERGRDDKNQQHREIRKWWKTRVLPEGVLIMCPNHHTLIEKRRRKKKNARIISKNL